MPRMSSIEGLGTKAPRLCSSTSRFSEPSRASALRTAPRVQPSASASARSRSGVPGRSLPLSKALETAP